VSAAQRCAVNSPDAASSTNRALVVIAEHYGAEFVAIVDYLNRAHEQLGQEEGIAVFLVGPTAERVVDAIVPRFTAVSRDQPSAMVGL
jgi:hypothetical protein